MGSLGSGRRYAANEAKATVENQISINILNLKNQGCLKPGTISFFSLNPHATGWVIVTAAAESLHLDYLCNGSVLLQTIQIASIPANYGGRCKYFLCPQCHSKRAMLYLGSNGKFACRICNGLVFRSSQLNPHLRHEHMAQKYTNKLGGTDFIFDKKKPFRMWHKTFFKLQDKFLMHRKKSCNLFIQHFDEILRKYGSVVDKEKEKGFA